MGFFLVFFTIPSILFEGSVSCPRFLVLEWKFEPKAFCREKGLE